MAVFQVYRKLRTIEDGNNLVDWMMTKVMAANHLRHLLHRRHRLCGPLVLESHMNWLTRG